MTASSHKCHCTSFRHARAAAFVVRRRACAIDLVSSTALVTIPAQGVADGAADASPTPSPAEATGTSLDAETEKKLFFRQRVFLGQCPDIEHLVHWLNIGAAQVVYTGEAQNDGGLSLIHI